MNIPKDGWMFGMGDGDREAVVCSNGNGSSEVFKSEAKLDESDWEIEYASDEFSEDDIKASFNRVINACINCSSKEDFEKNVSQYLDIDSAIDYYIYCLISQHHDGISKNCLLVTYDGVKWFFSAYDMDSTFGLHWDGSRVLKANNSCSVDHLASRHRVFELIKTYKAEELKARYKKLTKGALSEEAVIETFMNFAGSIPKALLDEEVRLWPEIPSTSVNNVSQIIDFYRRRRAYIDPQIDALGK